jgi:TolA-binding protein
MAASKSEVKRLAVQMKPKEVTAQIERLEDEISVFDGELAQTQTEEQFEALTEEQKKRNDRLETLKAVKKAQSKD